MSLDSLKKTYNLKDEDVKSRNDSDAQALESSMSKDYNNGAYGYLMLKTPSGETVSYKWTKENGKIVLKDFNSEKEISFSSLPKFTSISDIRIDNKKKK